MRYLQRKIETPSIQELAQNVTPPEACKMMASLETTMLSPICRDAMNPRVWNFDPVYSKFRTQKDFINLMKSF